MQTLNPPSDLQSAGFVVQGAILHGYENFDYICRVNHLLEVGSVSL